MKLYRRYEALSPIYQGGLTNHLPMMLIALFKMGVEKDTIIEKCDHYKDQKTVLDLSAQTTPVTDFEQAYINYTSRYLGEINLQGIDVVLGSFLSEYKSMMVSGLFHGLIRLAYAKESNDPMQIAQALAYYECISDTVDVDSTMNSKETALKSFAELRNAFFESDFTFETMGTTNRLNEIIEHPLVKGNLSKIKGIQKEDVLEFVLSYYLKTKNFYILHLITGFEAMLELEEYLYYFDELLNDFFVYAQLFVLFGEETEVISGDQLMDELVSRVTELDDAHDIKLLYSLSKLEKLFDQPLILKTANTIYQNTQ